MKISRITRCNHFKSSCVNDPIFTKYLSDVWVQSKPDKKLTMRNVGMSKMNRPFLL